LRSFYIRECSRLLDVDENNLLVELNKISRKKKFNKSDQPAPREESIKPVDSFQKKKMELSSIQLEMDVLMKLLQYGNQQIVIELINEKDEKDEVQTYIADYILLEINNDYFDFRDAGYKEILDEFRSIAIEETPALQHYFLNHYNENIRSLTTDILMSRYELSTGWKEKHRILTQMEDSSDVLLKDTIERTIFAFKLRNIELLIEEKQKLLDQAFKEKEDFHLILEEINKLNKAKSHFSKKLTRIILH
jgi:DNA primase